MSQSMLGTQELRDLVQTMVDTMRGAPGVGVAAPQIGIPLKVAARLLAHQLLLLLHFRRLTLLGIAHAAAPDACMLQLPPL